jgi:C4-dicarboxylate-specific signal transduction histidine kinase
MRAHLAELDRLMKRVGDAPAVGNYFQNAIDQIKGQQLTIGLTSAETLLSVAAATIKNFSREIRSGITGKQVGQRVKSDFAALEDACEQVEDHEVCLYDLLGHYIYARDARTRGMPSVYVAASELSSEEWQSFIRAAGRYDTTLRHIVSWSIDLQSSIGVAIEKHEVLVAEFDRQIGL